MSAHASQGRNQYANHSFEPPARALCARSPIFTGSMKRFSRMIRSRGAGGSSAPNIVIHEAVGATDAELAQLNRRLSHGSAAAMHRDAAWTLPAGARLHR